MSSSEPNSDSFSVEKQRVARHSMLAAAVMTLLKLGVGLLSGSLGVLSDAAHSGLDLVGAALTSFSVQVSDKPADEQHTYGHGKFENISSFCEVILMAASSAWIIWEAIQRMIHPARELQSLVWPVVVVLCSIGVDFWRSRQLRRVAKRTGSPALATDAFHFASDIWSSLAVLCGLGACWVGQHFGIRELHYADPLAALLVSLMILRLTVLLGKDAVNALLDEVPGETRQRLIAEVEKTPGVLAVEQARVRRSGARYFADLTLALPRRYTFEHAGDLVQAAMQAAHRALPRADVVIHTVPRQTRTESIFDRVRAVAAQNNVSVHKLSVQLHKDGLRVEQDLEVNEKMTLLAAHDFVTDMEAEILRKSPEIDSVLTHIESEPATIEQPEATVEENRRVEDALQVAAASFDEIVDVHEIIVGRIGDYLHLSCHCTLPNQLTMRRVHEVITALEGRLKQECPEVFRVTIHPEPMADNLR